jgi:hypothetical protein
LISLYEKLVVLDPSFEVMPIIRAIEESLAVLQIVVDLRLKPELHELQRSFGNNEKYFLVHLRLVTSSETRRVRGVEISEASASSTASDIDAASTNSSNLNPSPPHNPTDSHVTETDLDDVEFDFVYENNVDGKSGILDVLVPKLRELFNL